MLPRRSLATARAFAEAVFSGEGGPAPAERLDWLVADFADFSARAGKRGRLLFRVFLFAVAFIAPLLIGRLPTLRRLPLAERTRALTRMEASFASGAVLALKAILCLLWYEHPEVAREAGIVGSGIDARGLEMRALERGA